MILTDPRGAFHDHPFSRQGSGPPRPYSFCQWIISIDIADVIPNPQPTDTISLALQVCGAPPPSTHAHRRTPAPPHLIAAHIADQSRVPIDRPFRTATWGWVGACQGGKGPVTSRYKCRDRGETAGRYTLEGAKRSCVTRKRGKSGRKGQISRKGANLRVQKWL